MTEVLKLRVAFDGYYGAHVDDHILLPTEVIGVFFEELPMGSAVDEIFLGEIEGKHSEVYGDLDVELVDLDSLSPTDVAELIKTQDFNHFEGFFDILEESFEEELELDENLEAHIKKKAKDILDKYDVTDVPEWGTYTAEIHEKFEVHLIEQYVKNFKSITVLEEDYDAAIEQLSNGGIRYL